MPNIEDFQQFNQLVIQWSVLNAYAQRTGDFESVEELMNDIDDRMFSDFDPSDSQIDQASLLSESIQELLS